jgi:PAS domain S-box-containing protein
MSTDRRVVRLAAGLERCEACFDSSVGSLIDPFVLLRPLREDGKIVDFVYEYTNDAACEANVLGREELTGTRMLDRLTQLAPVGLFGAYVAVVETNDPLTLDDYAQPNRRGGEPDRRFFDVRALTAGELLVLTWRDVTERDRAEAERAGLAAIVRASDDAIVSLDADLRITTWNNGAEAVYGYTAEEILGKSSDVLIPSDASVESRGLREQTVAGGKVQRYETKRLHKDGTHIDVAITAFEQFDAAGDAAGVITITRDLTAHARATHALAASEGRYREILDAIPDGVWRVDAEERTDYVNPRMAAMLGYPPEEMIGHRLSEFMDAESQRVTQQELESARGEARSGLVENRLTRKDGTQCWTRVSHTPLTDSHGNHTGALAIISDISASMAQTLELRSTERFLAALTDSIPEGVCAIDRDGHATYMNQAAEDLLGWTSEELATRSVHETIHYQHRDGSPHLAADCPLHAVLTAATSIRVENDTFTRRDGRLLPVAYSASPITIDDEVRGAVVVFNDASIRWAEQQRREQERATINWVGRVRDAIEQLLRMVDNDGAIIAPGRFLPAAEQFGLIDDIDRWVLTQAIKLAAHGLKVNFNISGKSLGSRELIGDLVRHLRDTGADPALLVCEITETALANDGARAEAFVHELSELGCGIALDDFGVGYGGFAYLKRLPITFLKIDIQFVRDLVTNPQSQHVVRAIVMLAQGFGRQTIAEGVETQATLELLAQYGVNYAQGYAVGHPAPLENL